MDLTAIASSAALGVVSIAVPYGLLLGQQAVNAHIRDARLRQWATGALSAAGKAYATILTMREAQPNAAIGDLIHAAVKREADMLMINYSATAKAVGATPIDANSAVKGQLGGMLANDPTVSVAAAPLSQAQAQQVAQETLRAAAPSEA